MNTVVFLYYLGSNIIVITLAKIINPSYPITHWLLLFLGVILGLVFSIQRRTAFFYGFLSSFLIALIYTVYVYTKSPIMMQKFAKLLSIQPVGLILIMAILQGLLLGLAAFTGAWLRKVLYS